MTPNPLNNDEKFESVAADSVNEGNEGGNKREYWQGPAAQGLYDPINEHEACGVGFIVAIDGKRSHKVHIISFDTIR